MEIFVTGASGFIGSAVVRELIKSGYTIELGNMRSSRAARLNILKSPMAVSNVAGLSLFYH